VRTLIGAAFARRLTAVLSLLLVLGLGAVAYMTIPKEAAPDIDIPLFFVTVAYPGVSAGDSDRLVVRPLQRELQGISGLRQIQSQAGEGFAIIQLEFDPGSDNRRALADVREQVDLARPSVPPGAEEPVVTEVDLGLFPILTVALSGPVAERTLIGLARNLRDLLEALPGVLEADIAGDRDDLMEILVDPLAVESYRLSYDEVMQAVDRNNRLIAAGAFDTGAGRIAVTVPGVIEDVGDVLNLPVRVEGATVVRLSDVALVRQAFEDPDGFARINGQPTVALEIRRSAGANIIETVASAQAIIAEEQADWPPALEVTYLQNQAEDIQTQLGDLENSVITAVVLVTLTVVLALGLRASLLVALAIPGSFLAGILVIYLLGFTLNIVVLFGLILVVGMLVDGAVVVVELAERHMAEGMARGAAFLAAAQRMAWPITASAATTIAVFLPLLFWPGTAGQFMRFLPATVIATLLASLVMALIFIPVVGSLFRGRRDPESRTPVASEEDPPQGALTIRYLHALAYLIRHPAQALLATLLLLVIAYGAYGAYGRGVDFFPAVEPEFAQMQIQARGDLSIREADALVRLVEERVLDVREVQTVYARTIGTTQARLQSDLPEDAIGTIQLDFIDWRLREPASVLVSRLRERVHDLPGLVIQFREQERGPGTGLPVQVEIASRDPAGLVPAVARVRALMDQIGGFVDVSDDRPVPGIELGVRVNREEAARYGADIVTLGTAVQLLTNGILLGTYRPDFVDEEVDIRLRFPPDERTLGQLANLRISTPRGLVPIANFVELEPLPATGIINRVDGRRVHTISADVASGLLVDDQIRTLQNRVEAADLGPAVEVVFRGQAEDQAEAAGFLILAFVLAIVLMLMILVTQFNSLFQALLVLSAIVFSTAGVLLGLLVRQEPFGIVMSGLGIVALAGIVVNNNIVLIDAYNEFRARGLDPVEAALRTGAQRLRPVLLTAITTIVGLMPMVLAVTVDILGQDVYVGAPSTQYWVQLSTAVVGGLFAATALTVLVTPSMLAWWDRAFVGPRGAARPPDSGG
jgi:multidrug efflux pump